MAKIIVMMVWIGGSHGGAVTVPGFSTVEACERAIPVVMASTAKIHPWGARHGSEAVCVEMLAG